MMELLERLTQITGPSGHEGPIRDAIAEAVAPYVDTVEHDAMGNLLAVRKGAEGARRVMVSAHMDEIGFVATHIDDNGFVRVAAVGGIPDTALIGQRMRFAGGAVGVFGSERLDDIRDLKLAKLFVDIGASSRSAAAESVKVGEFGGYLSPFRLLGTRAISKSMDDRAGCAVAIEAAKRLSNSPFEVCFVFSTQEEVGCRGAKTASYSVAPDYGIAIDVTRTGDTPESKVMEVGLGKGPAVKVVDSSLIAHPRIRRWMQATAEACGIAYQLEVLEAGGTDAGAISQTRAGVPSGTISIPCRYIHSPSEMIDLGDLEGCADLLAAMLTRTVEV